MERDAFTGGVDPGGLWTKNDIRILICYILSSVDGPLSEEDLREVLQGKALANYFETGDALAALEAAGSITRGKEGYAVAPKGREIAAGLDTDLPLSVRDKALEAALTLMARSRSRRENRVQVEDLPNGCRVRCAVFGGKDTQLMEVALYVPDRAQARVVEENFYKDPEGVYRLLLAALTGEREFLSAP